MAVVVEKQVASPLQPLAQTLPPASFCSTCCKYYENQQEEELKKRKEPKQHKKYQLKETYVASD